MLLNFYWIRKTLLVLRAYQGLRYVPNPHSCTHTQQSIVKQVLTLVVMLKWQCYLFSSFSFHFFAFLVNCMFLFLPTREGFQMYQIIISEVELWKYNGRNEWKKDHSFIIDILLLHFYWKSKCGWYMAHIVELILARQVHSISFHL